MCLWARLSDVWRRLSDVWRGAVRLARLVTVKAVCAHAVTQDGGGGKSAAARHAMRRCGDCGMEQGGMASLAARPPTCAANVGVGPSGDGATVGGEGEEESKSPH